MHLRGPDRAGATVTKAPHGDTADWETLIVEFRRGIQLRTWQKLWHFNDQCPDYPTRGFAIAEYPPFEGDVCPRCKSLTRDKNPDVR